MSKEQVKPMELFTTIKTVNKEVNTQEKYFEFEGIASTSNKDRHGDVIPSELWTEDVIKAFEKNPVLLYMHDHKDLMGKVTELESTEEGLKIKGKIYRSHPQAEKVEDGLLKSLSISFITRDWDFKEKESDYVWVAKDIELLEISVVTIGANADAQFSVAKSLGSDYAQFKANHINKNKMNFLEKAKEWLMGESTPEEKAELKALLSEKSEDNSNNEDKTQEEEGQEGENQKKGESKTDDAPEGSEKSAEQKELEQLRADKKALEAKLAKANAKPVTTDKSHDPNPTTENQKSAVQKHFDEGAAYFQQQVKKWG